MRAILSCAAQAYEASTGVDFYSESVEKLEVACGKLQGTPWEEGDLERLFPDLSRRFFE